MYKTVLVKDLVEDGERLLQKLEVQKFPISAALWYYVPERMNWMLVIVSEVARHGSLEAYMRIEQAMAGLKTLTLSLDDILVMSPHTRQFEDLRRTIEGVTQMGPPGQRISLDGMYFEDAYVYRWPKD